MSDEEIEPLTAFQQFRKSIITLAIPSISAITIPFPFIVLRNIFVNQSKSAGEFLGVFPQWFQTGGQEKFCFRDLLCRCQVRGGLCMSYSRNVIGNLYNGYKVTMPPYVAYKWIDLLINKELKLRLNAEYIDEETGGKRGHPGRMFLCGAISGATAGFIFCPVERIQVHQNVLSSKNNVKMGLNGAVKNIMTYRGIPGFYRGLISTMCRDSLYSGFVLGTSYTIKDMISRKMGAFGQRHPLLMTSMSGVAVGCVVGFVTNPLDLLRTQQQGDMLEVRRSAMDIFGDIKQLEGNVLKNLWKGGVFRVVRIAFAATTLLFVLEVCKGWGEKLYPELEEEF